MEDNLIETWSGETSFEPNGTGRGEISRSDSEPQFLILPINARLRLGLEYSGSHKVRYDEHHPCHIQLRPGQQGRRRRLGAETPVPHAPEFRQVRGSPPRGRDGRQFHLAVRFGRPDSGVDANYTVVAWPDRFSQSLDEGVRSRPGTPNGTWPTSPLVRPLTTPTIAPPQSD